MKKFEFKNKRSELALNSIWMNRKRNGNSRNAIKATKLLEDIKETNKSIERSRRLIYRLMDED